MKKGYVYVSPANFTLVYFWDSVYLYSLRKCSRRDESLKMPIPYKKEHLKNNLIPHSFLIIIICLSIRLSRSFCFVQSHILPKTACMRLTVITVNKSVFIFKNQKGKRLTITFDSIPPILNMQRFSQNSLPIKRQEARFQQYISYYLI